MRLRLHFLALTVGVSTVAATAQASDPEIKIGGGLELNYTYNFNKPGRDNTALGSRAGSGNRNGYFFTRRDATFGVNLAEVNVSREATEDSRVGFRLRLIDGDVAKQIGSSLTTGNNIASSTATNFYEASVQQLVTDKLTVEAGILPKWIGVESIAVGANQFMTRSFQFGQFQPFYHTGVKATYAADGATTITGAVVNSFNGTDRSSANRDLGLGIQVARTLGGNAKISLNGLSARDVAAANAKRDIFNLVYTNAVNENTNIALDASYTTSGPTGGRTKGYAYTGYLSRTLDSGNVIALRGEMLNEDRVGGNLLAFGGTRKPSLQSITASYELKQDKLKGVRTLIEYRYDNANTAIFPTRTGAKKNQSTLTLSQVFAF